MPELKQCETCGGSGKYRVWAMGEYRTGYMKCYSCNGGSKIKTEPKLPSIEDELRGENARLKEECRINSNLVTQYGSMLNGACLALSKTVNEEDLKNRLKKTKEVFIIAKELRMFCLGTDCSTKNIMERFDKAIKDIEETTNV